MKLISLIILYTVLVLQLHADGRPNVIIILTDDQGYGDLSCHGNPVLKTPNLDKLHDQSVRFSDFHVASVCTPTRGELMSGEFALRNKAGMVPAGRNLMRRDIYTMPQVFADNGYATGLFGKWHLGDTYPHRPMDRGFQRVVWHKGWGLASEIEYDNSYYRTRYLDEMEVKFSDKFCANLWFDKAMEWMAGQVDDKRPFFSYIALNTPHSPFDPLAEDKAPYVGKVEDKVASFYGLISNIDQNFARLDDWLDKTGIRDNTLVLFMNDNGSSAGDLVHNAGMRGKKGSEYEGGHRAICFFRWPDGPFGQPRTVDGNAHITDILPTLVDLLNFDLERPVHFDGTSLAPVLLDENASLQDRKLIVQFGGRIRPEKHLNSCVMMGDWRLIDGKELYNIASDPGQQADLASSHPEIARSLGRHYDAYWDSIKDSIEVVEPVLVGHGREPYTDLTCNNWIEVDCDNRQWVASAGKRQAAGDATGIWQIEVASAGSYKLELSRWPFHMNRLLTDRGPAETIGGDRLDPGKALPIAAGRVSVDGASPIGAQPNRSATVIEMRLDLAAGLHKLEAWFEGPDGARLASAFYGRITRI